MAFNSTFRYFDDVLSINKDQFHSYVDSIYPSELEIKDTTESSTSTSYLDVLLNIDADRKLTTELYYKRDDFSFTIVNLPYTDCMCSNIPLSPAYGVYISQLIRYARAYSTYDQFFSQSRLLTDKLMIQGFVQSCLMSALAVTMIWFIITNFYRAICCVTFFIPIVRPYLAHWLWHRVSPHSWSWNWAHGRCDRSTGDDYSS
jgi:hypothetical protein